MMKEFDATFCQGFGELLRQGKFQVRLAVGMIKKFAIGEAYRLIHRFVKSLFAAKRGTKPERFVVKRLYMGNLSF